MAATTIERVWSDIPSNIGLLIRWLDTRGACVNWDAYDFARVCDEPWHWQTEWDELQAHLRSLDGEGMAA